ncbi:MAG: hypothetical protein KBD46_03015 [Candidatus Levybacteria bacterium]|nr:hypothetical protein [Candidatus Levybacteria bacterium]
MAYAHYLKKKKESSRYINIIIYLFVIIAPLFTLPQVIDIWVLQKIEGVSLTTWAAYTTFSFFWLLYGLYHREKPIIISNSIFVLLDAFIVIGILVYS